MQYPTVHTSVARGVKKEKTLECTVYDTYRVVENQISALEDMISFSIENSKRLRLAVTFLPYMVHVAYPLWRDLEAYQVTTVVVA